MAYILFADDDEVLAEMVRARLAARGHEVRTAEDGEDVLREVRRRQPDAILLDAAIPVRSGMATLGLLKGDPRHCRIPVIMMTSRRSQEQVLAALRAGASDYMTKPFSPEDLVLRLEGLLARKRFAAELIGAPRSLH